MQQVWYIEGMYWELGTEPHKAYAGDANTPRLVEVAHRVVHQRAGLA